ncbi:MAG: DUF2807 domain-containing protein [Legionella sp.]|nr:DUF2807 domain-containing protein [Legionella sp.]
MLARCLNFMCFMGFMCLVVGCTSKANLEQVSKALEKPQQLQQLYPTTQVRPVSDFTQIYIQGPFNVRLHTHKRQKPSLKIEGDAIDLKQIQSYVKNGVLYISDGPKKTYIGKRQLRMGEATVEINAPELHGFTYKGDGVIKADKIRSSLLDIWMMNSKQANFGGWINLRRLTLLGDGTTKITGIHSKNLCVKIGGAQQVELKGEANLKRLDMEGRGSLGFYWVKSKDLIVRLSGYAQLTLAGKVNRLDGVFSDHAQFHGRYLRVKEAFVKTNGEATSDIAVVKTQHALARDKSDIYYYNLPDYRMDFMASNGSVLDMRPEALKLEQPPTIYNH